MRDVYQIQSIMSQVNREKQDFLEKIACQLMGTAKRLIVVAYTSNSTLFK